MPKGAKNQTAVVAPVAPTPPPRPEPVVLVQNPTDQPLELVYDKLELVECSTTSEAGPVTVEQWIRLLGWETEEQYQERKVAENPGTKPTEWLFGETFHCKNTAGKKVRCNNNAQNRPFDMGWCEELIHTHLAGQWAGPHTIPGETVNGETIRVSRYGRMLSGQHTGTACILADEKLQKARAETSLAEADIKYPAWKGQNHVFTETIVITGMSEDPRVLMTVDYVKPRTAADVFYTSEVFKESTPPERKDMCKILATGVDLLWTRTDTKGYRTHPEIVAFLDRHMTLLKCVLHIFKQNGMTEKGAQKLSKLRLNPGHCSAVMFLMGCGTETTTNYSDEYRNSEPPSEALLDWGFWDKAESFWEQLAKGNDFMWVRGALGRLVDSTTDNEENQGLGGKLKEKLAILANAWERWTEHHEEAGAPFDRSDLEPGGILCLSYSKLDEDGKELPNDEIALLDVADFYGIDCPVATGKGKTSKAPPMPPPPSPEEIEKLKEEARARRVQTGKKE